ncbi:hypothetical protein GCK72_020104 [Caenorhabditis remanei]|uniref:Piwi domain-containing protein n=1 Tax=Caenorhabditis remanei TaxID=31234 RepID=A0A6A5GE80_CAERE|nr:hypothetical protein GCK72_020104 [Caenorhabditis remanei]KAF1753547.1 hypothetical protein GCK72_020104 [Caenorhabditis remanei]
MTTDPMDRVMTTMTSGKSRSGSSSSSTRTPKRDHRSPTNDEPSSKRSAISFTTPSSTTRIGRDSFAVMDSIPVQLNMFTLNLSNMPPTIERLHVDTIIICNNGTEINLNDGLVAVSGDVNSHNRRLSQHKLMRKFYEKKSHIFGGKSYHSLAYDCAATLYIPSGIYIGADEEEALLSEDDFSSEDWIDVSRICRRKDDKFLVRIKPAGFVETRGVNSLEVANRMELTRCVEIVTSQKLNSSDFYQFGNSTFPLRAQVKSSSDATYEIRPGFAKVARVVEGREGVNEMFMTIDTKLSPFYKSSSVLKFVSGKYAESRGGGGGFGGGGRGRGGFRGRGGGRGGYDSGRDSSRDSRGSYGGGRRDSRDSYDRRSDSRDSRHGGRDYRDSSRGDRRDSYDSRRNSGGDSNGVDYNQTDIAEVEKALKNGGSLLNYIEQALKGIFVEAIHLKNSSRQIRITGLLKSSAEDAIFTMKDGDRDSEISVADYFFKEYNIKLKFPHLPLVISKRLRLESFYPMEVLRIIPGQRIKANKMTPTIQMEMTGNKSSMPKDHVNLVQEILWNSLKLQKNAYMDAFGIEMESTKPVHLKAKLLPPAMIKFKNQAFMPEMGLPAFRNPGGFIDPARLHRVAIVVFDRAIEMRQAEDFCDRLYDYCRSNGIEVESKPKDWSIREMNSEDNVAIKEVMERWLKKDVDIVVGICKEKKPDVHDVLKYYEESIGMQTIQLCAQTVNKMMQGQGGRTTIDNVMRKFNLKCGGTNFFVEIPTTVRGRAVCSNSETLTKKLLDKVQFIGFEISHGSSRTLYDRSRNQMDGEPSIVGVSYSLTESTQLGGFSYMQTQREYKIQKLEEAIPTCVKAYKKHSRHLPSRIVIYRVGAGEGDFKRVKQEVDEIRSSFGKIEDGYAPQLVVIVAQKTSHARIFPASIEGFKASEQNVPSGTCIDNVVTSFGYDEFILSSQSPLIGTVRPCKYTILVNDPDWSKNELIHLTYFRAFGHQVSYQPPSVPDVLYAAENLAKRGKNNYKVHQRYVSVQDIERRIIDENPDLISEEMREQLASAIVDDMSNSMNQMTISRRNFWA